ncbi:hypothetical protein Tco_1311864 [Tanacetum coccineum]
MVNVIPYVDDVPVVEPNQHNDVPAVLEHLTYPYKEEGPLNPPSPASESEFEDTIEVKNPIEHEDETVPASVHEVGESSTVHFLHKDSDGLLSGLMRRDINFLFHRMASLLRRLCGRETAHALVEKKGKAKDEYYVEKLGNAEDKVECKELKKELEESRFSNTFLRMQNERVERDLYWTRVQAYEFYQEMIRRGFVFEERLNEAINENVDATIATERARHANVRNDARGSGPTRGEDAVPFGRECTFAEFMKCNPTAFRDTKGARARFTAATQQGPALTWRISKIITMGLETRFNELALVCPRMVKPEKVKVYAYIRGLIDNIKGEVTSSKPDNLNEVVRIAHKCDNCGNIRHKSRYYKEKNVAMSANALPIPTYYDYGEKGHTRNRCPRKVKQEEVGEVRGRAYAIKDAEPKGTIHFGKHGKLSPRYIRPFKFLAKCLAKGFIVVPMKEIQLDDKLSMIDEPVKLLIKRLSDISKVGYLLLKFIGIRKEV